jgi:hypothetical protein
MPQTNAPAKIGRAASCSSSLNEQRDTAVRRFPDLANRALIVKVTRLLRF